MNQHVEELYREARRFDEGEFYQAEEYNRLSKIRMEHYDALYKMLGPRFSKELSQFVECLEEELEWECMHYFTEGYIVVRLKGKKRLLKAKIDPATYGPYTITGAGMTVSEPETALNKYQT